MHSLPAPRFEGSLVQMELLTDVHVPGLLAAANEDRSLYAWNTVPKTNAAMRAYVQSALAAWQLGQALPFAIIRRNDGKILGSTRFANIERWPWPEEHPEAARTTPDVCEIGYTWLARSAIRSGVNTQAKRLLLAHAFERWHVHRVALRTDVRNARSRAAIERIGARFDGVLRRDRPGADGSLRDSAMYSIIGSEWPEVRVHLERLEQR